jgi:hypothetical protein
MLITPAYIALAANEIIRPPKGSVENKNIPLFDQKNSTPNIFFPFAGKFSGLDHV